MSRFVFLPAFNHILLKFVSKCHPRSRLPECLLSELSELGDRVVPLEPAIEYHNGLESISNKCRFEGHSIKLYCPRGLNSVGDQREELPLLPPVE